MPADFTARQERIIKSIEQEPISALIVSDRKDIFYYTGFLPTESDFAHLVFFDGIRKPTLFLSSLSNHAESIKTSEVVFISKIEQFMEHLEEADIIGIDERELNVKTYFRLKEYLKNSDFRPVSEIIKKQRMIKDAEEIRHMKGAIRITEKIFEALKGNLLGRSERNIKGEIEAKIFEAYAKPSFEPIVAAGKNSSFIHYEPGKKIIGERDLVVVDMGARHMHYCSDMTRTFCEISSKKKGKLIENIAEIQQSLIDEMKAGASVKTISELYAYMMDKKGYKVMHSWGHGVGLDVHDPLGDVLEEGMVVTVEPGAYIPGFGGCRIEDMVLIGKNGAKKLTRLGHIV